MPASTAERELWLPGVPDWEFGGLDGEDALDGRDLGDFDDDLPNTLEWKGGNSWAAEQATWDNRPPRCFQDQNLARWDSPDDFRPPRQDEEGEAVEENVGEADENDDFLSLPLSPGLQRTCTSSPELDYETYTASQRGRDRRGGDTQNETQPALSFEYPPSTFDQQHTHRHLPSASRMPSISNIVDLTGSSPSQRITTLAPRSYSAHSPIREPYPNRVSNSSNIPAIPTDSSPIHGHPPSQIGAKRSRVDLSLSSSSSSSFSNSNSPPDPSLTLPTIRTLGDISRPLNRQPPINPYPAQRPARDLPLISDYIRMPTTPLDIESIDLVDVDDTSGLNRVLAQQREQAILAQNATSKPDEDDPTKSIMTHYKCPVCMDVLTNATATACGHLFCHKCITDTLKFGERRAEEEGNPPRGNCPVCRKAINRNETRSGASKQLIQLKLMARGKKKPDVVDVDKGKGKAVDVGGREKRIRVS